MTLPIITMIRAIRENGHAIKADKRSDGFHIWIESEPEILVAANGIPTQEQIVVLKKYLDDIKI